MKKFIHIVLTCFLFIACLPVYSQISTFPNTTDFESGFGYFIDIDLPQIDSGRPTIFQSGYLAVRNAQYPQIGGF